MKAVGIEWALETLELVREWLEEVYGDIEPAPPSSWAIGIGAKAEELARLEEEDDNAD